MSLLLRRNNVGSPSALKLLDDASEALQYNRDLLQSALDRVRHGLGVFDQDLNLVCWNRQFRELLDLPDDFCRVGVPLSQLLRVCAERGDFGEGQAEALVADRMMRFAVRHETFQEWFHGGRRILEFRNAPMPQPQGGIVCTFTDITERVAAANELARANETLEGRVRERTRELEEAIAALAAAKGRAEEANQDKTRFLAAASHDLMQPLNAARLYASSLVERGLPDADQTIARNIDASLTSVEEIIFALIDISRLDAGQLQPEIAPLPLATMLQALLVEFSPMAQERGLDLRLVPTALWVSSDRRLLKRVLQNLISNAVKYTAAGTVTVEARQLDGRVRIEVRDTGPGIHASQHALIFREFQRGAGIDPATQGLGLGLSIVERIGQVLDMPIGLASAPGAGSTFWISLPAAVPKSQAAVTEETAATLSTGRLAGCTTLCIENEPALLFGMRQLLSGWGCEVISAASTEEAVAAIATRSTPPCVILADYHLDRGTGLEAVAAVRRQAGIDIPAVIITADHSPEVQSLLRKAGLPVLSKPLKAAALRAVIMHFAASQRTAAE